MRGKLSAIAAPLLAFQLVQLRECLRAASAELQRVLTQLMLPAKWLGTPTELNSVRVSPTFQLGRDAMFTLRARKLGISGACCRNSLYCSSSLSDLASQCSELFQCSDVARPVYTSVACRCFQLHRTHPLHLFCLTVLAPALFVQRASLPQQSDATETRGRLPHYPEWTQLDL